MLLLCRQSPEVPVVSDCGCLDGCCVTAALKQSRADPSRARPQTPHQMDHFKAWKTGLKPGPRPWRNPGLKTSIQPGNSRDETRITPRVSGHLTRRRRLSSRVGLLVLRLLFSSWYFSSSRCFRCFSRFSSPLAGRAVRVFRCRISGLRACCCPALLLLPPVCFHQEGAALLLLLLLLLHDTLVL